MNPAFSKQWYRISLNPLLLYFFIAHSMDLSRRCTIEEYPIGSWRLSPSPKKDIFKRKSFICCGSDQDEFKTLENYCGQSRQIPYHNFQLRGGMKNRYSVSIYAHTSDHGCSCDKENRTSIYEREKYEWVPSNACEFIDWNASEFCEYLGPNRTIMMIGDSTTMQKCITLINMIVRENEYCSDQIVCVRNDLLIPREKLPYDHTNKFHNPFKFTVFVEAVMPDIILVNTGHHYTLLQNALSAFAETIELFVDEVKTIKRKYERVNRPAPLIYWIQQQYGHRGCEGERGLKPMDMGSLEREGVLNTNTNTNTNTNASEDKYNWRHLETFDQIAKDLFLLHNLSYLDLSPLKYRSDAHPSSGSASDQRNGFSWYESYKFGIDCLHYCLPGPLDIFPRILLLHLMTLYSKNNDRDSWRKKDFSLPVGTDVLASYNTSQRLSVLNDAVVHCMGSDCPGSDDFYYVLHGVFHRIPNRDTFFFNNFSIAEVEYAEWKYIQAAPKGADLPACVPDTPRC